MLEIGTEMGITVKTDFFGYGIQGDIGVQDQLARPVHPYSQKVVVKVGAGIGKEQAV